MSGHWFQFTDGRGQPQFLNLSQALYVEVASDGNGVPLDPPKIYVNWNSGSPDGSWTTVTGAEACAALLKHLEFLATHNTEKCESCDGIGKVADPRGDLIECRDCNGTGRWPR